MTSKHASGATAAVRPETRLRITEIFHSLQGEANSVGWPTVFVRLTGCPLRCVYCDTAYAFHGGEQKSLEEILETVRQFPVRHVCVTGGEPLAQPGCSALLAALCDAGYDVSLETSGAMDVSTVDARVVKVMDIKTPDSAEVDRNRWQNLEFLDRKDQLKFVICSRADYEWARQEILSRDLPSICDVLLSPSYGQQPLRDLAEWILADGLPVRLQTQLHKAIWGEEAGH